MMPPADGCGVRRQVGWPPPLTGTESPAAAQQGSDAGPFERADDATLAELQRLIRAMIALQRSADPESFEQVRRSPDRQGPSAVAI